MINNRELRIGNYVLVDDILRKICCIKNDEASKQATCIGFEHNNECVYEVSGSERIRAVPISDGLLQDMGFIYHDYLKLWQHTRPDKSYSIELDKEYRALDFAHRPIVKNVQYLHRLQNLFFCIQGEELFFSERRNSPVFAGQ